MESPPPSPRFDYPIVRHHPLFAKTGRTRSSGSGAISSLLVGENVEYMRKPGDLSKSVQSVRKSTPKLLTFEIFNPETDDLDSDSSVSCSSDSAESVISVISDVRNMEQSSKEPSLDIEDAKTTKTEASGDQSLKVEKTVFKFDSEDISEHKIEEVTSLNKDDSVESESSVISDMKPMLEVDQMEKEIERKAEERKRILMSLLDENKSVLLKMKATGSLTRTDTIEEVTWKTTSQLQSMEELRIPSSLRSPSSSPERKDCVNEPFQSVSLENISSLPSSSSTSETKPKKSKHKSSSSKLSSVQKLKQISGQVKEEHEPAVRSESVPIEICITEHEQDDIKETASTEDSLSVKVKDRFKSASEEIKDEKTAAESLPTIIEAESSSTSNIPLRRMDKKKRDDSIESTTASVKSSVQLSDSGSVHSHRFSTVSISSNVSSDVSFGGGSAVSGSSCYLASMSSADFDDRPPLASSFSLSEADEAELLVAPASTSPVHDNKVHISVEAVVETKKKDQLSPPKAGKTGERPKLKSLFKRNSNKSNSSNERSKSIHSSNGSHDGKDEKVGRSRIGTLSSLTPETSLEQATCVERCSTSFEEELFRNVSHEANVNLDDNPFSASDSEDSAETGGSMTHHRYYHVFREGEIDHIIEKYVENLHIISSYYDHANWCIVAEKVNVWTI